MERRPGTSDTSRVNQNMAENSQHDNPDQQVQKAQGSCPATRETERDMGKIKDAIWKNMTASETGDHGEDKDEKFNKVHFSDVYKGLPSQVPKEMAKELSAPVAFVALLHLATEKQLTLEGTPELNDVLISSKK